MYTLTESRFSAYNRAFSHTGTFVPGRDRKPSRQAYPPSMAWIVPGVANKAFFQRFSVHESADPASGVRRGIRSARNRSVRLLPQGWQRGGRRGDARFAAHLSRDGRGCASIGTGRDVSLHAHRLHARGSGGGWRGGVAAAVRRRHRARAGLARLPALPAGLPGADRHVDALRGHGQRRSGGFGTHG
ncbi:hypothetical protein D3C81_1481750 [compost metagenome]